MLKAVKHILLDRDMTMAALAAKMGIHPNYLYRIMTNPREKDIQRIADALEVKPDQLKS